MLSRKAVGQIFDDNMEQFATKLISCIPSDANLNIFQPDNQICFPMKLLEALEFVREESKRESDNELMAALRVELSLFVNGQDSGKTREDYEQSLAGLPLCVDVHWQYIKSSPAFEEKLDEILDRIRSTRSHLGVNTKESIRVSNLTLELLTRLLKRGNLKQVLQYTGCIEEIETRHIQLINLEEAHSKVYLTEKDKYLIWNYILYYFMTNSLPNSKNDEWMNSLVHSGKATTDKKLFMIECQEPIMDKHVQIGCVNIILSMLRHFGNKACQDISRRPLLIGTLRTLFKFLSVSSSYKTAGTLILARKANELKSLQPEIQEIMIELELLTHQSAMSYQQTIKQSNRQFILAHQIASRLDKSEIETISLLLGSCVGIDQRKENEELIILVDRIRQSYLSLLGLDTLLSKRRESEKMKHSTFAWINVLILLQISKVLYMKKNNTTTMNTILLNQLDLILTGARNHIQSEEGISFIEEYVDCLRAAEK